MKSQLFILLAGVIFGGCATPAVIKGDVNFRSEPISKLHVNTTWVNSSGKKLNARGQAVLDYGLKSADLCNADPGLANMFKVGVTAVEDGKVTASKQGDFGPYKDTWLNKQFGEELAVNCCKADKPDRDMGDGNITTLFDSDGKTIIPWWLCDRSGKINEETLVLQPKLTRLDDKGLEITMDVSMGKEKRPLGSVSCSAETPTKPECIDAPVPDGILYTTQKDYTGNVTHPMLCDLYYRSSCVKKIVRKIAADFKH